MGGLTAVLKWIHSPTCTATKNARLVAVRIGEEMGRGLEASLSLVTIGRDTRMRRVSTMNAITEACGPAGIFDRRKQGPRRTNLYVLKTATPLALKTAMTAKPAAIKKRPDCQPAVRNIDTAITTATTAHTHQGKPLDQIPCPNCSREGTLTNSPGRNGYPPGFWCRRPAGCGMNFGLDTDVIVSEMTPRARRAIEDAIRALTKPSRCDPQSGPATSPDDDMDRIFARAAAEGFPTGGWGADDAIAQAQRNIAARGLPLGGEA